MKEVAYRCDLCDKFISDTPVIIKANKNGHWKKIGCDFVLTPRGHRLHARNGAAMIRVNAAFYCGYSPTNEPIDELHFHKDCIDAQVRKRVLQFFGDYQ